MRNVFFAIVLCLVASIPSLAQNPVHIEGLGTIDFPNSGTQAAQQDFIRGVLLLHSFEYGSAAEAFRRAQQKDPGFVMAYWGEAMTHNHPVWSEKDVTAAQAILEKMPDTGATEREFEYVNAIRVLYNTNVSKDAQDRGYMDAMRHLHEAFPEDDEALAFYALSILGSRNGVRDFGAYMKAAATAAPLFGRNPDHPGAAHYLIHSFDDPIHAPLGLPAADAYSEIAPNAAHAQHMTSHIFVAMGLWDRVVTANIRATGITNRARAENARPPVVCGHYHSWLHYGYLMLGQYKEAEELMDDCYERIASGTSNPGEQNYFASMRARHIVDSGMWTLTDRWTAEVTRRPAMMLANSGGLNSGPRFLQMVTDAIASLHLGDPTLAQSVLNEDWGNVPGRSIQLTQLKGMLAIHGGDPNAGIALLEEAAETEDSIPFEFGPPRLVKPTHETLGEALFSLGELEKAEIAFRRAAERTPGRPQAVMPSTSTNSGTND